MNIRPVMKNDTWPEFVTIEEAAEAEATARANAPTDLTGWETVVFELEDHEVDELLSVLSTAAIAP